MDGLRQRLMLPRHLWVALGVVVIGLLVALATLSAQQSAAHPAPMGTSVTLTFTVMVKAGTPPTDVVFWVCADAQPDGTGCNEMTTQPDGSFTFQLTTTTGTIYHHIAIEWSHGLTPLPNGAIPQQPAQVSCSYNSYTVTRPDSITCQTDFSAVTITPTTQVPTSTPAPAATAAASSATGSDDNGTLITGLYIVIGVGLVLFVILLCILIWQRMSARRRGKARLRMNTQRR